MVFVFLSLSFSFSGARVQRGSEELLSHSPMVTNGSGMSPTQPDINNDAKKVNTLLSVS